MNKKKTKYKISIITVVYNGAKTIEHTIKSILEQSYENKEYIIIDGQSTDGTQQLVSKYMDSLAYFISEKDVGIYDAMNKGVEHVTGDYVIFINSDDRLTENILEQCAGYLNDNVDILYGDTYRILEDGVERRITGKLGEDKDIICRGICHQAVLARTELLKENRFDLGYKIAADYDWLLKVFCQGAKFRYIPRVFSHYCTTGYSMLNRELCTRECYKIVRKYLRRLDRQDQERYSPIINEWYYTYLLEDLCGTVCGRKLIKNILKTMFSPQEKIFMFGCGNNAKICLNILNIMGINVLKIIDNNKAVQGTFYQELEIVGLDSVINKEVKVVVSSTNYEQEIYHQLVTNGFMDIILFSDIKSQICQEVKVAEENRK